MEAFSEHGGIVSVPAGAGYAGAQPTVLVSRVSPSGIGIFIESVSCRALDIDLSQISFALWRNGSAILNGTALIPGVTFQNRADLLIKESLPSGTFSIVAYNLSGTGLPHALPAVSALCQASWMGQLERPVKKLEIRNPVFYRPRSISRKGIL